MESKLGGLFSIGVESVGVNDNLYFYSRDSSDEQAPARDRLRVAAPAACRGASGANDRPTARSDDLRRW